MTAAGRVRLRRGYFRCGTCGMAAYPLDDRVGLTEFLSPQATRLACLAAASWSFDVAADRLAEFAGVTIDDETLRRSCHRAADVLTACPETTAPAAASFAAAEREVEFLTDGAMAPTRDGWRELKPALWPPGLPAEPAAWATRPLPPATAQVAFAEVADCESFSSCWGPRARALGIEPAGVGVVLADGAEWIWRAATRPFPDAGQVLDIFHAARHLAAAGNALFGDGSALSESWTDEGRRALLADGWLGLCVHVGATLASGVAPRRSMSCWAISPSTRTAWGTTADSARVVPSAADRSRDWRAVWGIG